MNEASPSLEEIILCSNLKEFNSYVAILSREKVAELVRPHYLNLANEMVAYARGNVEINSCEPCLPSRFLFGEAACFTAAFFALVLRICGYEELPTKGKRMLEAAIIAFGALGYWCDKKCSEGASQVRDMVFESYTNALVIQNSLIALADNISQVRAAQKVTQRVS